MVIYSLSPERVPKGKARGNSQGREAIFDRISRIESYYEQYQFSLQLVR